MAYDTFNKRRVLLRIWYQPDGGIDTPAERKAVMALYHSDIVTEHVPKLSFRMKNRGSFATKDRKTFRTKSRRSFVLET